MTRAPKLLNEDGRPAKLSLFVDAGLEPYATGILDITITGQSVVFDGPDGAHFEGTLHDLCETIRASITMAGAQRDGRRRAREGVRVRASRRGSTDRREPPVALSPWCNRDVDSHGVSMIRNEGKSR